MTLMYEGQEIDIAGAGAKIFNQQTKQWEDKNGESENSSIVKVYGKEVLVEALDFLISYKSKLAREVDLEDVKQLKAIHDT